MKIWQDKDPPAFTPPGHFGDLKVSDIVPFADGILSVQVSKAPPGAGGEMHHHDTWSQVFYILAGELTFDTGQKRFTLRAGESVLFEPQDAHYTKNEGREESVSLVITVKHDGRRS